LDAGTGLRELAESLNKGEPLKANLFLTHTHLDHVCGLPFFQPLFSSSSSLQIWSGHLPSDRPIRQVLDYLMMDPLWPIQLDDLKAKIAFHNFVAGETLSPINGIDVKTVLLNHPNGATGYRISYKGKSVCYVTDTEHFADRIDENIVRLAHNADILIYDSTYTPADYKNRVGWGHSTWEEGVRIAKEAGVRQFVVFHHNPEHDDDDMDAIASQVCGVMENAVVAREGMVLCP